MKHWDLFLSQLGRDFKLWCLMMALLSAFRLIFLFVFRDQLIEEGLVGSLAAVLLTGMQFDSMAVTYFILPSVLLSTLAGFVGWQRMANACRALTAVAFSVLTPVLCCGTIEYFREFDDNFNPLMFNTFYDNQAALATTAYDQYHLVPYLGLTAVLMVGVLFGWRRLARTDLRIHRTVLALTPTLTLRTALGFVIVAVVVAGLRGSVGHAPVGPGDSAVSTDRVLNKSTINPYMALVYATKKQLAVMSESGLASVLHDDDILAAAERAFPESPQETDVDLLTRRIAAGPKGTRPRHILVLGVESYDAWPLMEEYRSLGLAENLRRIAERGLHINSFSAGRRFIVAEFGVAGN